MQVESGRSDSVASHGSLQSSEEVSSFAGGGGAGPSRPADNSDITSFSIRRPVSDNHKCCLVNVVVQQPKTFCGSSYQL